MDMQTAIELIQKCGPFRPSKVVYAEQGVPWDEEDNWDAHMGEDRFEATPMENGSPIWSKSGNHYHLVANQTCIEIWDEGELEYRLSVAG